MFIHSRGQYAGDSPGPTRGLVIATDYRSRHDSQLDEQKKLRCGDSVLDNFRIGRAALGEQGYYTITRIALFEHDATPTAQQRHAAKAEFLAWLKVNQPRVLFVIPNESGTVIARGATLCWQALGAADSLGNMRGTLWEYASEQYAMAAHPNSPWLKQVQLWQQGCFLQRAGRVAHGSVPVLQLPEGRKHITPGAAMLEALKYMLREARPLAIDIETMMTGNLITAIGVSDGLSAVSIPHDEFMPHGGSELERGIRSYPQGSEHLALLQQLLSSSVVKFLHNFTFDIPRLEAAGFTVSGPIHDTMAAHAIAFPELRHGLQHAAADMLAVPPWKSLWHPKLPGYTRDDEEYWICDPVALRTYNCDDCFYTWHLARAVLPCVGVKV